MKRSSVELGAVGGENRVEVAVVRRELRRCSAGAFVLRRLNDREDVVGDRGGVHGIGIGRRRQTELAERVGEAEVLFEIDRQLDFTAVADRFLEREEGGLRLAGLRRDRPAGRILSVNRARHVVVRLAERRLRLGKVDLRLL